MTWLTLISFAVACALFSALVTWISIHYARRRSLLDLPGQRRSHSVATPRGGGIGIVAAVLAGLTALWLGGHSRLISETAIVSVIAVAAVGWIDDHRGLSARARLLVHLVAVVTLYLPLFGFVWFLAQFHGTNAETPPPLHYAVLLPAAIVFVLANIWFVNLHNFMDGIDGLLACQAIFVFLALSILVTGDSRLALVLGAAATAGFLPFNFPRARVFMGDVGSGTLGLLIAAAVVLQALSFRGSAFSGLIACSAFVTDATCTLISRMLRGRRWYSAHREHLYQWLARCGLSHVRVVGLYMGWNLLVAVPVLYVVNRAAAPVSAAAGFAWTLAVYAPALIVWILGKRWCLSRPARMKNQEV